MVVIDSQLFPYILGIYIFDLAFRLLHDPNSIRAGAGVRTAGSFVVATPPFRKTSPYNSE